MIGYRARKLLLLGVVLLLVTGPVVGQSRSPERPWAPRPLPPDEDPQYFPTDVFGSNRNIMAVTYSWYLRSMQEKPLAEFATRAFPQVYRVFVETRPYNAPVVVRLSIGTTGTAELVAKVGQSGGHPEVLTVNRTKDVSRLDVDKFLRLLGEADFWSTPTQKPLDIHHVVMGEAGWMLEGIGEGRYHLVHRGASELGPLKDALTFLVISLANVDLRSLSVDTRVGR